MRELGAELVDVRCDPEFLEFYVRGGGANIRRPANYRFRRDWEAYLATLGPNVPKTVEEFIEIYESTVASSPLPVAAGVLDLLKRAATSSTDDPVYRNLIDSVLPEATKIKLAMFDRNRLDALVFPYRASFASPIRGADARGNEPRPAQSDRPPDPATLAGYGSVGFPGIVVPMGFGSEGLPMTISFMGRPCTEGKLIGFAYDYEQATRLRRPPPLLPPLAGDLTTTSN